MQRVGSVPDREDIVKYIVKKGKVSQENLLSYFNSDNKYKDTDLIFYVDINVDKFNRFNKSSGKYIKNIDDKYIYFGFDNFRSISDLDDEILDSSGLYCIRLKENSKLPERYQNILDSRKIKYIYIGKATNTLRERLKEELEHVRPGTFFRSIGCVLGYRPLEGHLMGMANQNNYRFSDDDTASIIDWLKNNVEVSINKHDGDFTIEADLIKETCPLLNIKNNPNSLQELKADRQECIRISRGKNNI